MPLSYFNSEQVKKDYQQISHANTQHLLELNPAEVEESG